VNRMGHMTHPPSWKSLKITRLLIILQLAPSNVNA
jgi:hypothetical protein